jgi:hypothetical protein
MCVCVYVCINACVCSLPITPNAVPPMSVLQLIPPTAKTVYMHACMYVCINACVCTLAITPSAVYVCIASYSPYCQDGMYACMYVSMHVHMLYYCTYVAAHTSTVCMHACMYELHVYIHTDLLLYIC